MKRPSIPPELLEEIAAMLRREWHIGLMKGRMIAADVIALWEKLRER